MFLGVENSNISRLVWNGLVGNGAPVPTENYLLNRTIETNGEFTYFYYERLVNGGQNDISLANCNFMMVGEGPLIQINDIYLVLQHSVKPTFLENCVTIFEAPKNISGLKEEYEGCSDCRNSTCQLAGYSDEECFVKWSSVVEDNAVDFYFKIKTPSTPSWFALGFNPTEKEMVMKDEFINILKIN